MPANAAGELTVLSLDRIISLSLAAYERPAELAEQSPVVAPPQDSI
jgi:hypothetical protein